MNAALQERWQSWLRQLQCGNLLDFTSLPPSPALEPHASRFMMMNLSHAYVMAFHTDAQHPQFLPHTGEVFSLGGPNPDAVYYFTSVEAAGLYRISGWRNTVRFVDLQTGQAMWGFPHSPGQTFPSVSLDSFSINADGSFEILLGTQKPEGYEGNWLQLDASVDYILVRQFAYSWQEQDARLAIERLDAPAIKPEMPSAEIERRMQWLADYFNNVISVYPRMRQKAAGDRINEAAAVGYGVGELARQVYLEGTWQLEADEALLCEVQVPESCFYWNVQAANMFWMTLEMTHRLSSVNGHQAHTDTDGITRIVFAAQDPGVPNWIDTGGLVQGDMIWRWLKCSSVPNISYRKLSISALRAELPASVKRISAAERNGQLRQRARDAQLRRKW